MNKQILERYILNFEVDLERIEGTVRFAKDAIKFIINKNLYSEFLQFQVNKREEVT